MIQAVILTINTFETQLADRTQQRSTQLCKLPTYLHIENKTVSISIVFNMELLTSQR